MACLITASASCSEDVLEPSRKSAQINIASGTLTAADSVARAFAMAMADPKVRSTLRDHLRDNPFEQKRVELVSYVSGPDGKIVAEAAARALQISENEFIRLVARLAGAEILIPRAVDRLTWEGTDDIVVFGTTATIAERYRSGLKTTAFTTSGARVEISTFSPSPVPYIAIRPAERPFPDGAEALRKVAPRTSGATVSTRAEEREALELRGRRDTGPKVSNEIVCDFGYCYEDTPPAPPPPSGAQLPQQYTLLYCLQPVTDLDRDGIDDDCEFQIAYAMRPLLNISNGFDGNPLREPHWAVSKHPSYPQHFQIFYALSYHEDTGDATFGFYSHHGDSEFIILDVVNTGQSFWAIWTATLSAHWDGEASSAATYSYDALEYTRGYRQRPRIWVARGKHANYRSKSSCDGGGWANSDTCDGAYLGWDTEVRASDNLGNYYDTPGVFDETRQRLNCVASRLGRPGIECFWTYGYFAGWYGPTGNYATPYHNMFYAFQF